MATNAINFSWIRYWGERDGAYHIDRNGFLDHSEFYKDSFEFNDLREQRCLLLLGEPGIGKSFAVKEAAAREISTPGSGAKTLYFDLRSYGSEDRLHRGLFQSEEVVAWRKGDHTLHLFLDSLDECLLRVDTVAGLLVDEFGRSDFPRERLMLRIACRTADVPPLLESELFHLWSREGKNGIYELCPLQRTDVLQAAEDFGLDFDAFLTSVIEHGVGTLAARPITLRMLLNLYSAQGEFPKSPVELYEAGCRALCDEPNVSRRGSVLLKPPLSPDETLIVAARIAAFTVLCNRAAIWTGMETGENRPEDILVREMLGGHEEFRGIRIEVDDYAIRNALRTGLFSSRGANRQGWAHQTFAEFLAAWYLNNREFELARILELVTNAADGENKPPPQLGETLAWLASLRVDVREHLLKSDPVLLLRSDAATFTDEFKAVLVDELLRLFAEGEILDEIDLHSYYRRLRHPAIASQLRGYIVDTQQSAVVRRIATDIAQECEVGELQKELVALVLDEEENFYLRANAGYAVWQVADAITRAELRPLALNGSTKDIDLELKGVALLATWPNVITADEAFAAIVHPPQGFHGAYSGFLSRFVGFLNVEDLPYALRWVRDNYTSMSADFSLKRVMDEIIIRAEQHITDASILDLFSQTLAVLLRSYSFRDVFNTSTIREDAGDGFLATEQKRRSVLQSLSKYSDGESGVADAILRTAAIRPTLEDLPWLLNQLGRAEGDTEKWFFARLVGAFYGFYLFDRVINFLHVGGIDPTAFTMLAGAVQTSETVRDFFGSALEPIDLESELASNQREWYETAKKRKQELEDARKTAPLLDPPPRQRVEEFLKKVESGELNYFWGLSQTLTLEPDSQHYRHWSDSDITEFAGWKVADLKLRARIIEAAKKYIVNGEPQNDVWVGTISYQNVALAGYYALCLVFRVAPEFVGLLSVSVWEKWAPIITLFPLYYQHDKEIAIHQNLVKKAYDTAPAVVLHCLSKQIDLENTEPNAHPALSDKFEGCWDEHFRGFLREQLEKDLKPVLRQTIIRELLMHKDEATEEIAQRPMEAVLRGEAGSPEELKVSVVSLSQYATSGKWANVFWRAVSTDVTLGRILVETAAHFGSPASHLSETDAASFYIWLEEQYPHDEDPPIPRGSFVGVPERQELAQWRDGFLRNLVNRGTRASVEQLERISTQFPALDWLKRYVIEARAVTRRNIWEPIAPHELFRLIFKLPTGAFPNQGTTRLSDSDIDDLFFTSKRVGKIPHLSELLREFRDRPSAFVFFIGAGLSVPLFPSWPSALESLMRLRYEQLKDGERNRDLEQMFMEGQYLEVADICAGDLGQDRYRAFIADTFGRAVSYEDIPTAYKELLELAPQTVLTTNYDGIPDVGASGYQIFSYGKSPEAMIAVQQFASCIFRVHGSATEPDSIVFTATEYQNTYQDGAFIGLLEAVIRTKYLIFLGFSFTDPFFTQLLETVFAVNRRLLYGKYALLEGLSPTQVEGKESRYGLSIIPYMKSDDTHPEVVEFVLLLKSVRVHSEMSDSSL